MSYIDIVEQLPGTPYGVLDVDSVRVIMPKYLISGPCSSVYHCLVHQLTTQTEGLAFYAHPAWMEIGAVKLSFGYTEQRAAKRILVTLARTEALKHSNIRAAVEHLGALNPPYEACVMSVSARDATENDREVLLYPTEEELTRILKVAVNPSTT